VFHLTNRRIEESRRVACAVAASHRVSDETRACVQWRGDAPSKDVGGRTASRGLLEAVLDPVHEEHRAMLGR